MFGAKELFILTVLVSIVLVPVNSIVLMLCWNNVMPHLFKLPEIGFIHSLCLTFIARILIKGNTPKVSLNK